MDGTIDMIATDHAPHIPEEKERESIWTCDCGFPGVETQMPLMLSEVAAGRITICDYVRWTAFNPAHRWGLYPRKGTLQVGTEADIVVVDLDREAIISDASLHSRAKITPWDGRPVKGVPVHTLVRGEFVMRDRVLNDAARGKGRSVHSIQEMPPPVPKNTDASIEFQTGPGPFF